MRECEGIKNMKKIISIILLLILMFNLCSCTNNQTKNETRTIVDCIGDEVKIPTKVDKVINLVAYGTQIMVGLGLGDYLVGINEETIESAWISEMYPRINEIATYGYEESAESLLAANADIVFVEEPDRARFLREKGVPAVTFGFLSIEEMQNSIKMLGDILGNDAKEKCNEYLAYMDSNIKLVKESLDGKLQKQETLYYINGVSNKGLYKTSGKGSTNHAVAELSMVDFATENLIEFPANKVDSEAILAINPENIIIGGLYQHVLKDELLNSPEWKFNTAVKEGNVFTVPMGISAWNRYGIEIAMMITWTSAVVYPELFDYDIVKETINFYEKFAGYKLTETQAMYILNGLTPNGEKEIAN